MFFGYSMLGKMGELGNQMFQYATLYALCNDRGCEGLVPDTDIELYSAFPNLSLKKCSKKEMLENLQWVYDHPESFDFAYNKNVKMLQSKADLRGYFQSVLYFINHRKSIVNEFQFREDIKTVCTKEYNRIANEAKTEDLCVIHFRRGDYLEKSQFHYNLNWQNYYVEALSSMLKSKPNMRFVVFSDDYQWCRENVPTDFIFHNMKDQYHDLCLMSMFQNHIIANSSFSWWGAYLSGDAWSTNVIAPAIWFGPQGPKNWNTIYCPGWQLMGPKMTNPLYQLMNLKKPDDVGRLLQILLYPLAPS